MVKWFRHRFALSEQGAKDLIKGIIFSVLQNVSFMFPVGLLYCIVADMVNGKAPLERIGFYTVGSIICLVLVFVLTGFQYDTTFLATYVETGVRRVNLAERLRKIPLSFFGKKDLADLTSTIMNDCAVLETTSSHFLPPFLSSIISTVLIAISLFFFDWRMALSSLWVLPVSFIVVALSTKSQGKLKSKQAQANVDLADGTQEYLESIRDLKANNFEDTYIESLVDKIYTVEKRAIFSELGTAIFVVTAQLILKLGIVTMVIVGSKLLTSGSIDVLTFFMFLLVVSRLYDPLKGSLENLAAIISTKTNIDRMNEILEYPIQEGTQSLTNDGYDIDFKGVEFSYNGNEKVIDGISFTAKQGEVTALVGSSGGGKTTVSRLASRFWDIDRGQITVGGMDISNVDPESLLSLYSIVFQDVTLFNNTIMENIRIGRKDATDEEVLLAGKLANCNEFAEKLPNGYDTNVGENGCALSGGERQRISIARAFLKDAPIILLDEATASLDVENETLIQTALSRLIKDKTVLIIAHRMRTVMGADKVIVLKDGKIIEEGSPSSLMSKDGAFSNMVKLQTKSSNWKIV